MGSSAFYAGKNSLPSQSNGQEGISLPCVEG